MGVNKNNINRTLQKIKQTDDSQSEEDGQSEWYISIKLQKKKMILFERTKTTINTLSQSILNLQISFVIIAEEINKQTTFNKT